jgi:hypothetical protein
MIDCQSLIEISSAKELKIAFSDEQSWPPILEIISNIRLANMQERQKQERHL